MGPATAVTPAPVPGPVRRRDGLEPAWLAPVLLAAVAGVLTAHAAVRVPVLLLLAVALVPWGLGVGGRRWPALLFGATAILPVVGIVLLDGLNAGLFLGTAAVSQLAGRCTRNEQVALVTVLGVSLPFLAVFRVHPFDTGIVYFAIGNVVGVAVGLLLGRTARLGEDLRAADARLAAASAQQDRTRLARDVHDLVAHSLTVVVLQVGGARRVLRSDPAAAETALLQAERVARDSLDGVREVVGLLRTGDGSPAASLDLDHLVQTYRSASVRIDVDTAGDLAALPVLVRGTVYRVVREALANAARYRAPDSAVDLSVRVTADAVTVGIDNAVAGRVGATARRPGPGGHGLTGLAEQVAAVGGTLAGGPTDGGWSVACRVPLPPSRTVTAGAP